MILVTGGTGHIGSHLLRQLADRGVEAGALTRRPDASLPAGIEAVSGSFEEPPPPATLARFSTVFLLSPATEQQAEQERGFVDALVEAGASPHIVKLAVAGIQQRPSPVRFVTTHQQVLEHLGETGLTTTVLAPNSFLDNLLASAEAVREQSMLYAPASGPVSRVATSDIAAVAAHVLTSERPHEGATYTITGPAAITYADIAAGLSTLLGREIRLAELSEEDYRGGLLAAGLGEWLAEGLVELAELERSGAVAEVTDEVRKATGYGPQSLADWLTEHRAAFA